MFPSVDEYLATFKKSCTHAQCDMLGVRSGACSRAYKNKYKGTECEAVRSHRNNYCKTICRLLEKETYRVVLVVIINKINVAENSVKSGIKI